MATGIHRVSAQAEAWSGRGTAARVDGASALRAAAAAGAVNDWQRPVGRGAAGDIGKAGGHGLVVTAGRSGDAAGTGSETGGQESVAGLQNVHRLICMRVPRVYPNVKSRRGGPCTKHACLGLRSRPITPASAEASLRPRTCMHVNARGRRPRQACFVQG
eukprot:364569-Chlamydomonas_euryale.AAC.13